MTQFLDKTDTKRLIGDCPKNNPAAVQQKCDFLKRQGKSNQ